MIWSLLILLVITVAVSGCARWPNGSGSGPGEKNYQLNITVEVNEEGTINTDEGIYYIVFYADGITGPAPNVNEWEGDFYYIKLDGTGFHFIKIKDDEESSFYGEGNKEGNSLQVIVALSELEDPKSININVVTTDSENNTYDHLDDYFTVRTESIGFFQNPDPDPAGDSQDGPDFDITKVTAKIIIP